MPWLCNRGGNIITKNKHMAASSGVQWLRAKLQADAILRYHGRHGLLQQVPELLQHWVTCPATALQVLHWLAQETRVDTGLDVEVVVAIGRAGVPPPGSTALERLAFFEKAVGRGRPASKDDFDPYQVLVPLVFGGKAVLAASHASAIVAKLRGEDGDVAAAAAYGLHKSRDAGPTVDVVLHPRPGFAPHRLASRLRRAFRADMDPLIRAAYKLGCLGKVDGDPTASSPAIRFGMTPPVAHALVLSFARHVDATEEQSWEKGNEHT